MCVLVYNIRTLQTEDDLDSLIDEVDQTKWGVIGFVWNS